MAKAVVSTHDLEGYKYNFDITIKTVTIQCARSMKIFVVLKRGIFCTILIIECQA